MFPRPLLGTGDQRATVRGPCALTAAIPLCVPKPPPRLGRVHPPSINLLRLVRLAQARTARRELAASGGGGVGAGLLLAVRVELVLAGRGGVSAEGEGRERGLVTSVL